MDLLRLPAPLRRAVLDQCRYYVRQNRGASASDSYELTGDVSPSISSASQAGDGTPSLLTLDSSTLNAYNTSFPPNDAQLNYASSFFRKTAPHLLFTAAHFRSTPPSPFPEVAFLGRSNVGKSSLLNALFGRTKVKDAHVSKRPGCTKTMNGFGIAGGLPLGAAPKVADSATAWKRFPVGGLIVVDMPGYSFGGRQEWGQEALKYLQKRKQLRKTFVLIDVEHGLKQSDISILTYLRSHGISHQIILSKVDKLLFPDPKPLGPQKLHNALSNLSQRCARIRERLDAEINDGRHGNSDILCCSAEKSMPGQPHHHKLGIAEMCWAVLTACGLESDSTGHKKRNSLDNINILEEHDLGELR